MFRFLRFKDYVTDRKLRLFACGYARQEVWEQLADMERQIVCLGELYADDAVPSIELEEARQFTEGRRGARSGLNWLTLHFTVAEDRNTDIMMPTFGHDDHYRWIKNLQRASRIVRDLFGPIPFRTIPFERTWLSNSVTSMAECAYTGRAFDRLPILGDALEDAGCGNADILAHCRQPGEHVRGCWVVDLLLGKK
jgi:hypothetical protein